MSNVCSDGYVNKSPHLEKTNGQSLEFRNFFTYLHVNNL